MHDYADIDYELLADALARVLDDYEEYVAQVATWLAEQDVSR